MIFNSEGSTTIVTQEKTTIIEFVKGLENKYHSFKSNNIIINLFSLKKISQADINEFLRISNDHKAAGHSFVIVTDQEAYDLVEMEEIERELGF